MAVELVLRRSRDDRRAYVVDGVGSLTYGRWLSRRAELRPVEGPGPDRYLSPEIEATVELVRAGDVVRAAEGVVGPLA